LLEASHDELGQTVGPDASCLEVPEQVNPMIETPPSPEGRSRRSTHNVGYRAASFRDDAGMSIEDNKTLVRGFIARHRGDLCADVLAPTFVNHDPPVSPAGMDGSCSAPHSPTGTAVTLIAEDDIVVERFGVEDAARW
jgi:hypothetical protein